MLPIPETNTFLPVYTSTGSARNRKIRITDLATEISESNSAKGTIAAASTSGTITHNLGTFDVMVQLFDDVTKETVYADVDDVEDLRGPIAARLVDRSAELFQEDPSFFTSNNIEYPIGEPGRQRGNSKTNDTYVMIGIGVMYYFGDLRCPYDKTR